MYSENARHIAIAILDDKPDHAKTFLTALKEMAYDDDIGISADLLSRPDEILSFVPNAEHQKVCIIDQNMFNGFNSGAEFIDTFPSGEEIARKIIENGYSGLVVLFTGDDALIDERNNPTFFKRLFSSDNKPEGLVYLSKNYVKTVREGFEDCETDREVLYQMIKKLL